jgi:hypothetical protein
MVPGESDRSETSASGRFAADTTVEFRVDTEAPVAVAADVEREVATCGTKFDREDCADVLRHRR